MEGGNKAVWKCDFEYIKPVLSACKTSEKNSDDKGKGGWGGGECYGKKHTGYAFWKICTLI